MNRKFFLNMLPALFTGLSSFGKSGNEKNEATFFDELPAMTPPYLKRGDIIGITCPAGFITAAEIMPAINKMKEWGFRIKVGNTVGKRDFTFGGTDAERVEDIQQMLNDHEIKAIMCARGGYGAVRIIDKIDFKKFVMNPKW